MRDLTERLRLAASVAGTDGAAALLTAAADELERLRLVADRTPETTDENLRLRAEVERLRTDLDAALRGLRGAAADAAKRAAVERTHWESHR